MSGQPHGSTGYGIGGRLNWALGGAIGGLAGSAVFGAVLWVVDPTIVTDDIPTVYGLEPGAFGWGFHAAHGIILGVVFGFLVTRKPIMGAITTDAETDFLAAMGLGLRLALAGVVYGLAIWTLLPLVGQSILSSTGTLGDPAFPVTASESLVGHMLYGFLLGTFFSVVVDLQRQTDRSETPFEEGSESARG